MTLRGIARARRRTLLTVTGMVIAVCLVMVFAGLRDTVNSVINRQYGGIELQDAQVVTVPGAADSVASALRFDPHIGAVEPFTRVDATLEADNHCYDTLLIGLPSDTQMHRFTSNGSERRLGDDGVLLGQGLAQRLGIRLGDLIAITLQQNGIRFQQRVAGFVNEPMNPVGYIAGDQLSRFVPPSGVTVKLTPGTPADILREKVTATPGVIAYLTTESVQTTIRDAFSLYNALVGLMLVFAGAMAAALLYNAMSANVGERTGELSTLQAAGMGPGLLGRLVATENLMLVLVGLPA